MKGRVVFLEKCRWKSIFLLFKERNQCQNKDDWQQLYYAIIEKNEYREDNLNERI